LQPESGEFPRKFMAHPGIVSPPLSHALEGAEVVVTGGFGGLGRTVLHDLLAAGANCHVPFVDHAERASFKGANARLNAVGDVDLTNPKDVTDFYASLPPLWASIHLAGGFAMAPIAETTPGSFLDLFSLNAFSCFLCCQGAIASMRRRANTEIPGGRIVNVAARPALDPKLGSGMVAYAAAKAAIAALTVALGEEVAPEKIWVNAIAPTTLDTPGNRAAMPDADHTLWTPTAHVSQTIQTLISPHNQAVRSAVIPIYGTAK
jgi:NAD(P)-dependent dehydrogenase (short-subunit alcohol dehydrogenase family)